MLQILIMDYGYEGSTYLGLIEWDTPVSDERDFVTGWLDAVRVDHHEVVCVGR